MTALLNDMNGRCTLAPKRAQQLTHALTSPAGRPLPVLAAVQWADPSARLQIDLLRQRKSGWNLQQSGGSVVLTIITNTITTTTTTAAISAAAAHLPSC